LITKLLIEQYILGWIPRFMVYSPGSKKDVPHNMISPNLTARRKGIS